ncbi:hypothetical protein [Caldalkalibacillus mannanilyticus]|uniref:hypothetical protein n=1 Tax=Caldalkalibacillus mannanilyticus TaxID=1418 RepID=UPI000469245C|nr:hypothetical protein [Caldalkalibacillus mannanilyticus]
MNKHKKLSFVVLLLIGLVGCIFYLEANKYRSELTVSQWQEKEGIHLTPTNYFKGEFPLEVDREVAKSIREPFVSLEQKNKDFLDTVGYEGLDRYQLARQIGTYYPVNEVFPITMESFFQDGLSYFFEYPEDEDLRQQRVDLTINGFWMLESELFLDVSVGDLFSQYETKKLEEKYILPYLPIDYAIRSVDAVEGINTVIFEHESWLVEEEDGWKMVLNIKIESFPLKRRYLNIEPKRYELDLDVIPSVAISRKESLPISHHFELKPVYPGRKYEMGQKIRLSPDHELEFVRMVNYYDHAVWEVIVHSSTDVDVLNDFRIRWQVPVEGSVTPEAGYFYQEMVHLEERGHFLLFTDRMEDVDQQQISLQVFDMTLIQSNNITIDLEHFSPGDKLFSYLGWTFKLKKYDEPFLEPPTITLELVPSTIEAPFAQKEKREDSYELTNGYFTLTGIPADAEQPEVILRSIAPFLGKASGRSDVAIQFAQPYRTRSYSLPGSEKERLDIHLSSQSILYHYKLMLPEFMLSYQGTEEHTLNLHSTDRYYEAK